MATDGLTNEERVLAWIASWSPSFAGKAIVNEDFTFRSVNHQFCKILGVTPAELINKKFTDITPQPLRDLEKSNSELVINGLQNSYLLPKTYELQNGTKVDVTLLVNGVYHPETAKFMFFVSTIMERVNMKSSVVPSQKQIELSEWIDKKKIGYIVLTSLALAMAFVIEKTIGKIH